MKNFQHPLLYAEHAYVPEEQRQQLACCCLCGCNRLQQGVKLSEAWQKVVEQAAEGSSSSSRYTTGVQDLGTDPLYPTFTEQASRQHGLWACAACVRSRAKECQHEAAAAAAAAAVAAAAVQPSEHAAIAPTTAAAFPHHIAAPLNPLQQQQQAMLTRRAKDRYEEELGRQSGERKQQVAELQHLKEQQGLSEQMQQRQQNLLADMQQEHARTTAELQVLRRAVQVCIGAPGGTELVAVDRSREKERAQRQRAAATDAHRQQKAAEQRLGALQKTTDKLSASLTSKAAAANEALKVKAAELEQEQERARELEEQLEAAATQHLSLKQQQEQQQKLKERYRVLNKAHKAVQQQVKELQQDLAEMHLELDFGRQGGNEEGLDDEDFEPETGEVLTMPAALEVNLVQWRQEQGRYDPCKLNQLVDVLTQHLLHGRHVRELLYGVLSVSTGLPRSTLSAQLPSCSTQHHDLLTAVGRKQQVQGTVGPQQQLECYGLECYEGTFARHKHFVVQAVLPYRRRQLLGAPTMTDISAQTQLDELLAALREVGKAVQHWLYFVSDSAAPSVKAYQVAQELKDEAFRQPADGLRRPTTEELPDDLLEHFLVVQQTGFLLPRLLIQQADLIHIFKNAEVHAMRSGFGGGVHPAHGRFFGDLVGTVLFQFARLFAGSPEFREYLRLYCPAGRLMQTIPGVVKHRLLIKPTLARVMVDFQGVICHTLWKFNEAFGQGRWKSSSRQATMDHAREVWLAMQLPQFSVWASILAHTLPLHELVYSTFQQHGGFLMCTAPRQLKEVLRIVEGFARDTSTIFAPELMLAQQLCADPDLCALQRTSERLFLQQQPPSRLEQPASGPNSCPRASMLTPSARSALSTLRTAAATAGACTDAEDEEDGEGAEGQRFVHVLHMDGEGEVRPCEQQQHEERQEEEQQGVEEAAVHEKPRKRQRLEAGAWRLGTEEAMVQQMEAIRKEGPAAIDPQQEGEAAAPGFTATPQQLVQEEGEMSGEQWAKEVGQQRPQQFFQLFAAYLRTSCTSLLSITPNPFRIASYWDSEVQGTDGGFGAFTLDCHLTSNATGRHCPPSCPHCSKQLPKWDRLQHLANTASSLGFFDRCDHAAALDAALQQGQLQKVDERSEQLSINGHSLNPLLDQWHARYLFGSVHSMETDRTIRRLRQSRGEDTSNMTQQRQFLALCRVEDQLEVTDSRWAAWRKEAAKQAEEHRNSPSSSYPALLLAALQKQQLRASKRPRLTGSRATNEAEKAAQRRQQDPAAVRVRLVREMRYLPLKKAALLALQQSEQQQGQQSEQQQQQQLLQQQDEIKEMNLEEVTALLLDARWSTEKLTLAHDTAKHAAADITDAKRLAKKSKKQQQQQQQQGQGQEQLQQQEQGQQGQGQGQEQQQQQQQEVGSQAASATVQAVIPAGGRPTMHQCVLVRQSFYESSDDSGSSNSLSGTDGDEF